MLISQLLYLSIGLITGFAIKWAIDNYYVTKPEKIISNGLAMELIHNFQKDNPGVYSGHLEWDDFNNYLKFIKKKVKSSGKNISGLEYYFARYGKSDQEQPSQQTIVIFPTYEEMQENPKDRSQRLRVHIPFDPENTIKTKKEISIKEIYKNRVEGVELKKASVFGSYEDSILAYNRSQMCPPRTPETL